MQNASTEPQIGTSFPNDNRKHIDYVIKYAKLQLDKIDHDDIKENIVKESYRRLFFEQVAIENIEIYDIVIKHEEKEHYYVLLNCPMKRLLTEADTTKLEMKLKTDQLKDLKYEVEVNIPIIKFIKDKLSPMKEDSDNNVSTNFDKTMKNLFYGINDEQITPWLFSTTIRSLLVDNILNNIELNHQDLKSVIERVKNEFNYKASIDEEKHSEHFSSEQGLPFMLHEGYFDEAFTIHDETDHKFEMQQFLEKAEILYKDDQEINAVSIHRVFKREGNKFNRDIRFELFEKWANLKNVFKYQPINLVRDYFGEEYALYFAWVGVFITTLWIPTLLGIIFFIIGVNLSVKSNSNTKTNSTNKTSTISLIFTESFDNDLTPYYALIICLWGAFFLECWKRENANLAYAWNVLRFESDETDLPEYVRRRKYLKKYLEDKSVYLKYIYNNEKSLKMLLSIFILMFMIGIVALDVAAVVLFRIYIKLKVSPDNQGFQLFVGDIGSTVLNALFTISLNWLYDKIAITTTQWENHRTRTQFKDNLIYKTFAFQFVNNYASLFYLAFFRNIEHKDGLFNLGKEYQDRCENDNCMALLSTQIFVSLMIKPLPSFLTTVVLPLLVMFFKGVKLKRITQKIAISNDPKQQVDLDSLTVNEKKVSINLYVEKNKSDPTNTLADEYTNKVIIFGYVMLFASAFSLGPLIFLIVNLIDLRVDAQRLIWLFHRPVGYRAQDIGSWYSICRLINVIAIIVNGLVIAYTSKWSKTFLNDDSTNRLIFFVAFEHVVFGLWYLITLIIPDIPSVTRLRIRQEQNFLKKIITQTKSSNEKANSSNVQPLIPIANSQSVATEVSELITKTKTKKESENNHGIRNDEEEDQNKKDYDLIVSSSNVSNIQTFSPRKKTDKHLRFKSAIMPEKVVQLENIEELERRRKNQEKLLRLAIIPVNDATE